MTEIREGVSGMRILICDDDHNIIEELKEYLNEYFAQTDSIMPEIAAFSDGNSLLADSGANDLVFLDIEMPGLNGISVGNALKKKYPHVFIFITTYHEQYLDDAMDVPVFRYLLKPLDKKRLFRNLDAVMHAYCDLVFPVAIDTGTSVVTLSAADIIFIETQAKATLVHTVSGTYSTKASLVSWMNTLSSNSFFQTHKGYLVNMRHIKSFEKNLISFHSCEEQAYLSRRKCKEFKKRYFFYISHTT